MKKQGPHETSWRTSPTTTDPLPGNPLLVGVGKALTVIILASQLSWAVAFSILPNNAGSSRPHSLLQAATTGNLVQPVQPRRYTSHKQRQEAVKAMDAKMLELLSEQFLYPSPQHQQRQQQQQQRDRPRGRPESVPGAMGYEATLRFRQENEGLLLSPIQQQQQQPYASPPSMSPTIKEPKKKQNHVRGSAKEEGVEKKRKKVVKNLPEPRIRSDEEESKRRWNDKSVDLQKYYRTELLTAKEEYSLGMKIHFMMRCEEVHEGLAARLMRLPTMEEWAHACG
jgi:hypothetical protein